MAPPNGAIQPRVVNPKLYENLTDKSGSLEKQNAACLEKREPTEKNRFFLKDEKTTLDRLTNHGAKLTDKSHTLVFKNGDSTNSVGGYDQKLAGCSYNQNGVTLSVDGVKANEVKATYTDATGNHVEALDLKTLQTRELPQQKYLTP